MAKTRTKKTATAPVLECGHPDIDSNLSKSAGCLMCDSGAPYVPDSPADQRFRAEQKAISEHEEMVRAADLEFEYPDEPVQVSAPLARAGSIEPTCTIHYADCIRGMAERMEPESVHLTVTSIPFEELFTYSGKPEDVGNNGSTVDIRSGLFAVNMRFVVEQLFRVTAPGCPVCIHIQQLLAYKNQHGFMGRRDFRGAMVDVFTAPEKDRESFRFVGDFAICKDPQAMAQRLSLHSLQFKTGYARTATNLAPAPNDYVLVFQKPGEVKNPVRCLLDKKNPHGWVTKDEWVRDAHGIWTDINEMDILDGKKSARESDQEKHVCPLQLEVIRRLVRLYTNPIELQPGVTVLDPFMGIGSTAWVALNGPTLKGDTAGAARNVVGFELKGSYHAQAEANVAKLRDRQRKQVTERQATLFDEEVPA